MVQFITCNNNNFDTWFPHRLESEDHARPWFNLFPPQVFLKLPSRRLSSAAVIPRRGPRSVGHHVERAGAANLLGPQIRRYFLSLWSRGTFWRPSVRGAPSRGSFNLVAADSVGNRVGDVLSVALLGKLRELNATILSLQINRRAGCFAQTQVIQSPPSASSHSKSCLRRGLGKKSSLRRRGAMSS